MSDGLNMHPETEDHPLIKYFFLTVFVAFVWAVVIFLYRCIMGFWDVEDVWETPYRTYTYIISLITIVATVTVLIKAKRAEDAAEEKSEELKAEGK
jgi:membrane protein DedA with SNARE-associated domain